MSLHSESNQLYFDFVYSDYFNKHSEFKFVFDLINQIDWPTVPKFNNPYMSVGLVISVTLYLRLCSFKRLKGNTFLNPDKFNFLADAAYDSSDIYDFVHLKSKSTKFISLKTSSKKLFIASDLLAHSMGRDDLLASPKTLMYETATYQFVVLMRINPF